MLDEFALKHEYIGRPLVDTIFIGGGTPSLLTPAQLKEIGGAIEQYFELAPQIITYRSLHELARWTYEESAAVPLRRVRWKPPPDFSADFRGRDDQNRGETPARVGEVTELL